ncbi:MAG: DUF4334 domain-containing protein [Rhizobiaceae bacterium]|nr:DUF4334 domain-containing protein [Rhizobiaceae bacterium]
MTGYIRVDGWHPAMTSGAQMREHGTAEASVAPASRPVAPSWLVDWEDRAISTRLALGHFDGLGAVEEAEMLGRWRGRDLPTGHPLDGVLGALSWFGKDFRSCEDVDPLLFRRRSGTLFALDPACIPLRHVQRRPRLWFGTVSVELFRRFGHLLATRRPTARLRSLAFRGVVSAAMIYDSLPVIDCFRRIDATRVLGLMDLRGIEQPFFFLLRREADAGAAPVRYRDTGPTI